MKQGGSTLYRILLLVGYLLIMMSLVCIEFIVASEETSKIQNETASHQNETQHMQNNASCVDVMWSYTTESARTDLPCEDSGGWNLKGSDWGCCGNYQGCCTYASLVCYFHDALCRCCDIGSNFCGPTCKPEIGCSPLLETDDDETDENWNENKHDSDYNSTKKEEQGETEDKEQLDTDHLDVGTTFHEPTDVNEAGDEPGRNWSANKHSSACNSITETKQEGETAYEEQTDMDHLDVGAIEKMLNDQTAVNETYYMPDESILEETAKLFTDIEDTGSGDAEMKVKV